MVLFRLGLRAAEIAALHLEDIDWRAGEIVVRGKGRSEERLPLPFDVGHFLLSLGETSVGDGDGIVWSRSAAPTAGAGVMQVNRAPRRIIPDSA